MPFNGAHSLRIPISLARQLCTGCYRRFVPFCRDCAHTVRHSVRSHWSATPTGLAAYCLPTFPDDEGSDHQSRHWISPRYVPDRVDSTTDQCYQREVSTQG